MNFWIIALLAGGGAMLLSLLALHLRDSISFLGIDFHLPTRRERSREQSGTAIIEDSTSSHGGAYASGAQQARISRTIVAKDLVAETDMNLPKEFGAEGGEV